MTWSITATIILNVPYRDDDFQGWLLRNKIQKSILLKVHQFI